MQDPLGDRMKRDYENRTRHHLPRRTYALLRCDGKAFHTFTKNCERPFDVNLMAAMDAAARALCERVSGARFAYVQSDEIQLLLTDFETPQSEAWFDGNLQKIASVSASIVTAFFNRKYRELFGAEIADAGEPACFDARVWTIAPKIEVYNAFLWR